MEPRLEGSNLLKQEEKHYLISQNKLSEQEDLVSELKLHCILTIDKDEDILNEVPNLEKRTNTRESSKATNDDPRKLLSGMLKVDYGTGRAKSPVTVQEWVAALPDLPIDMESGLIETQSILDNDNMRLGAEAGFLQYRNPAKIIFNNRSKKPTEKRNLLTHSDTLASLNSEQSNLSNSSVDSLLQAREADPVEVLIGLGFGGKSSTVSRIPSRFFQSKSKANIDINAFLQREEEQEERFQSGYCGYRGLVGNSSRRPSEIVEKIIATLRERERELRRRNSTQSWTVSSTPCLQNIPARFRLMDPNRPTFETIVKQLTTAPIPSSPRKSVGKFRMIAKSVLCPENQNWRREHTKHTHERRKLHLGGKCFLVDNDGNEIIEEEEEILNEEDAGAHGGGQRKLEHQDSLMSLTSTVSIESDWSDDEREELEKLFGVMSEKGEEYTKLRQLRRSRRKSRRKGGSRTGGGTSSTASWDGARLVYSRESSISEITASMDGATSELETSTRN